MGKLMDLWAENGANILDDDDNPTLSITNSSTAGVGLETNRLVASSAATIAKITVPGAILAANATIANLNFRTASVASGAMMAFTGKGALVSLLSIDFAASANWAGIYGLRVCNMKGEFGWVPVLPNAVVVAATA